MLAQNLMTVPCICWLCFHYLTTYSTVAAYPSKILLPAGKHVNWPKLRIGSEFMGGDWKTSLPLQMNQILEWVL